MCIWLSKFKASALCPALHNKVTLSPVDRGDHNAGQEQQALDAPTLLALRPQERLRFCPQKPQQLSLQHWKRSWARTSTAVVPEVFQLKGASANPAVGHWQQSFCHKLQLHEMIWVFFCDLAQYPWCRVWTAANGSQAQGNADFGSNRWAWLLAAQEQKMRCIKLLSGQSLFYMFASQQRNQVTQTLLTCTHLPALQILFLIKFKKILKNCFVHLNMNWGIGCL